MPKHREVRQLPWSAAEMFDLVADIGRYGEFLPWVQGMRVGPVQAQADGRAVVVADMIVGFRMIRERFTSRVTLERPSHIHVDYLDGPMKHLFNDWRFRDTPSDSGGCEIDFAVDFEFRNKAFETLAGLFFAQAFERMVGAFVARAEQLYGPR